MFHFIHKICFKFDFFPHAQRSPASRAAKKIATATTTAVDRGSNIYSTAPSAFNASGSIYCARFPCPLAFLLVLSTFAHALPLAYKLLPISSTTLFTSAFSQISLWWLASTKRILLITPFPRDERISDYGACCASF